MILRRLTIFKRSFGIGEINSIAGSRTYSGVTTITGLPFKISPKEAFKILEDNRSVFETDIREDNKDFSKRKLVKAYIPFHTAQISNLASKFVGERGDDRTEFYTVWVSDGKGGGHISPRTRTVTDWRPVAGKTYPSDYNQKLEVFDLHVSATFEFPDKYVKNCLVMANVNKDMFQQLEISSDIKIYPHNMNYSMAFDKILKGLTNLEEAKAKQHIIDIQNCDHSSIKQISMILENITLDTFSYHIPAYLYITEINGKKICKIINGYNGNYDGDAVYCSLRTGLGGTAIGMLIGLATLPLFPITGTAYGVIGIGSAVARLIAIRIGLAGLIGGSLSSVSSAFYTEYQYETTREKLKDDKLQNEQSEETLEDVQRKTFTFVDKKKEDKNNRTSSLNKCLSYKQEFVLLELPMDVELTHMALKEARTNMLKKWHPDINKGDKDIANLMTSKIIDAYNKLHKLC